MPADYMQNDFPSAIVNQTAHRPWPLPESPWVMTQSWHDLLFAHWPADARKLREKLPAGFDLDLFDGQAWVGVVPFHMTNVAPRFMPAIPWVSEFPEINVRTYVTVGGRPGVYFFSLDADSALAVKTARALLNLPYYTASMSVRLDGHNGVAYETHRTDADGAPAGLIARYQPTAPWFEPRPGTLEYFLTERYCLYNVDASYRPYRLEIHHVPWRLQAADAAIDLNTMAQAAGIELPGIAPVLHFSKRQDTVAWAPEVLESLRGTGHPASAS